MSTKSELQGQNKKTYLKYSRQMRIKLIDLVEKQKMSTAEAGRIVGIKQTSACRIINSYKKYNRIFQRKADKILRQCDSPDEEEQKKIENLQENKKEECSERQKRRKNLNFDSRKKEGSFYPHEVTLPNFQRPLVPPIYRQQLGLNMQIPLTFNPYGLGMPFGCPFPYFC